MNTLLHHHSLSERQLVKLAHEALRSEISYEREPPPRERPPIERGKPPRPRNFRLIKLERDGKPNPRPIKPFGPKPPPRSPKNSSLWKTTNYLIKTP